MNRTWRTGRHRDLGDTGTVLLVRDGWRALRERGDGMLWVAVLVAVLAVGCALVEVKAGRLSTALPTADVSVSVSVGPVNGEPLTVEPAPSATAAPTPHPSTQLAPALAISGPEPSGAPASGPVTAVPVKATPVPTAVTVYPTAVTFVPAPGPYGGYGGPGGYGGYWGYGGSGGGHR